MSEQGYSGNISLRYVVVGLMSFLFVIMFSILMAIGAWYFSKIEDKGTATQSQQNSLVVDIASIKQNVGYMQLQLQEMDKTIKSQTSEKWTSTDHSRYDAAQQNIHASFEARLKFLEDQLEIVIRNQNEIKKTLSEL